ncbi:MAG TPA: class I SAM-dependent methyltransferase [Methylomirabilota bacterium]|nr:class I SAM-dependent methyltransferase [Methylomirabilota bacterium]
MDSKMTVQPLSRESVEKTVEPIILDCLRRFGDFSKPGIAAEEFAKLVEGELRPDVRRISLLVCLAQSATGPDSQGEGLELGCGYGYLLLPMAVFNPHIRWTAVEHPSRNYFNRAEFRQTLQDHNCQLVGCNITHEPLPFPDAKFSVLTFSETLEHLPVERLNFVLDEISRVIRPGGLLIASSPNQASLENRLRLLKGNSILDLPNPLPTAKDTFPHIRLYTPSEMSQLMQVRGFSLVSCVLESNNSTYRDVGRKSFRKTLYRLYELAEQRLPSLRRFGDTWFMVFRKNK